jgi:hypothetical protein
MKLTRLIPFTSATLAPLLLVAAYATAVAQRPAHAQAPAAHTPPAHPTTGPRSHPAGGPKSEARAERSFGGIASKLGTTPAALEDAFEAAHTANPKLTRGQFIAANVLAKNLGSKNPAITTQAILDGLKSGSSIGKTLHSLGLSESEAKEAERAADREVKEAKEKKPDQPKP